ncbi:dihydrolipoyl dehydrogenase [Sarcoptes scabiei]|nr:dihydrolipoyl dehydrogenase [Sarcoptes scabiei]
MPYETDEIDRNGEDIFLDHNSNHLDSNPIGSDSILESKSVDCTNRRNSDSNDKANKTEQSKIVSRDYLLERRRHDQWNCLDHIIWFNVFWFSSMHLISLYAIYLVLLEARLLTILFAILVYAVSIFGITAGVHRLWSHRAYKAKLPFRIILAIFNSMAYQNSIYVWARDHRVHHKYSETDADPVNIERGFFFSHIGWLLCKKHPDVARFGLRLDLSDLKSDPVVYYQHKFYHLSVLIFFLIIPTIIPWYFWNESLLISLVVCVVLRYTLALNSTWLVNSVAHKYGNRPYDINIAPTENKFVAFLTLGEGYHNYHHTFPWDYSTSEWQWNLNPTTIVLDLLSKTGLVYDLRSASKEIIKLRKSRTGNLKQYQAQELGY